MTPLKIRPPEEDNSVCGKCFSRFGLKLISVEPTMFLYMFAFMTTTVIEQDLYVQKACLVNNNFTEEICKNLNAYPDEKKQVQITTSKFHQYENIAAHIFPIILALFLGSWSDRRGRKLPLLIGLCGKLYFSLMVIVNAKMKSWPVEYIIYTATLPSALTGADVAIFASCFAYISDISSTENRTIRVTILDACYLTAMPTGIALGSFLFNNIMNKSHANMFAINSGFLILSIIYTIFALKWQTTLKQQSMSEVGFRGFFGDFFDKRHVKDSIGVLTKKRSSHRRSFLIILLISMALYTFQRDEKPYLYLHTQLKFDWDVKLFSKFKTFQSFAYVIAMFTAVPFLNKLLGWRDTSIIFIGTWAHTIARIFYFFAKTPDMLYAGGVVCSLGPIVAPMIRSITSKMIPQSERGKVFSLLSVCDNAVPFISGICYSQIYRVTINNQGSGVFLLTITTQLVVFVLILSIHLIAGNNSIEAAENNEKKRNLIVVDPSLPLRVQREAENIVEE